MPTVPGYGGRRVKRDALPGVRKTSSAETFESTGGTVAQAEAGLARAKGQAAGAQAAFGATAAKVGLTGYAEIQRNEREKADQIALLTAERQLGELEVQLLHSSDKGALNVKGKDVIPLRGQVLSSFDEQAGLIAQGLGNDRQRLAFEQAKQRRRLGIFETVERHTVQQLDAYEKSEAEASLANGVNMAVSNYDNPKRIAEELGTLMRVVDDHGAAMGMGPEARTEIKANLKSKVHEGVIVRMLVNQQEPAARQYFEELKDQISGDAIARIEEKLKVAGVDRQALAAADDLWAAHAPADDDDPVSLDVMEAGARLRFKDSPDVLKATIAELRSRKAGVDSGRKERADARDDTVWSAVMEGASLAQVRRTAEFVNMDGKQQTAVRDYFQRQEEHQANLAAAAEARANAREGRELTKLNRTLAIQKIEGYGAYFDIVSDPAKLRAMSTADIRRQLPVLGPDHVESLLREREQLQKSDDAVKAATIDNDLFRQVADEAGMAYVYGAPRDQTPEQRGSLGQLRATVEAEIAKQQQDKKRQLTFEEKRSLMQSLMDRKVILENRGRAWFDSDPVAAAIVTPAGRESAYVPIDQVPKDRQARALNYLRGLTPGTDAELLSKYRRRIERAYALKLLGASDDEQYAALEGSN